ncbi:MAG TPA: hypothetical protein H9866_00780 [Candidatus Tidjanibacter gallistercoris]|nr:hypothetical protein [Candidatus Tidjanibacter gallistercoris]
MKCILLLCFLCGIVFDAGARPVAERPQKTGLWHVEASFYGFPFISGGFLSLNGSYSCRLASWFAAGGGAGLELTPFEGISACHLFVRLRSEVPAWNVAPLLLLDGGIGLRFTGRETEFAPVTNTVLGVRCNLDKGHDITVGFGIHGIWPGDSDTDSECGSSPFMMQPFLHFGFTF